MKNQEFDLEVFEFLALFQKAEIKFEKTQNPEEYKEVLEKAEKHKQFIFRRPELIVEVVAATINTKDFEEAEEYVSKCLEILPEDQAVQFQSAYIKMNLGKLKEAYIIFELLDFEELSFWTHYLKAKIQFAWGNNEHAFGLLQKSLNSTPHSIELSYAHSNIGYYYLKKENRDAAEAHFLRAVDLWKISSEEFEVEPVIIACMGLRELGIYTDIDYISQCLESGIITEQDLENWKPIK